MLVALYLPGHPGYAPLPPLADKLTLLHMRAHEALPESSTDLMCFRCGSKICYHVCSQPELEQLRLEKKDSRLLPAAQKIQLVSSQAKCVVLQRETDELTKSRCGCVSAIKICIFLPSRRSRRTSHRCLLSLEVWILTESLCQYLPHVCSISQLFWSTTNCSI